MAQELSLMNYPQYGLYHLKRHRERHGKALDDAMLQPWGPSPDERNLQK